MTAQNQTNPKLRTKRGLQGTQHHTADGVILRGLRLITDVPVSEFQPGGGIRWHLCIAVQNGRILQALAKAGRVTRWKAAGDSKYCGRIRDARIALHASGPYGRSVHPVDDRSCPASVRRARRLQRRSPANVITDVV